MTKILSLVKTRDGTSIEAFREYWRNVYLPSILELKDVKGGIAKVAHNHAVPLVIREDAEFPPPAWAGVGEMWFDRREDAESFLNHPALAGAIRSHAGLLTEIVHLHCTELPIWDLGLEKPSVKMIAFFHPSTTMTRAESQDYWTNKHVAVGQALNDPTRFAPRYVQNHVLPEFHTASPEHDFAGAPELWFYSEEAAQRLFRESDNMDELNADEAKFSDRKSTVALVTDESVVYTRPGGRT
jgi:uncharacterized protein (TIGR02118 family)